MAAVVTYNFKALGIPCEVGIHRAKGILQDLELTQADVDAIKESRIGAMLILRKEDGADYWTVQTVE